MNGVFTSLRLGATALLTGLTAASTYYPHQPWIPIAIATVGALGIHVIPSVSQTMGKSQ